MAQELTADIQDIPYDLLQSLATERIDFEGYVDWQHQPVSLPQNLNIDSTEFATAFLGQTINGQISGSLVDEPLALLQLNFLDRRYIARAISSGRAFDSSARGSASRGSVFQTMYVGGNNRLPANMLTGWAEENGNKLLTSLSPRIQLNDAGGWSDFSVVGIEPVAMIFETDQTAIGFLIVALDRHSQTDLVHTFATSISVQVKFFRRDGSLISQVSFPFDRTIRVAFARCGEARDIAGIQITNSSKTGLAFDDFIFGMPEREIPAQNALRFGLAEDDADLDLNPLDVEPCSFNIS